MQGYVKSAVCAFAAGKVDRAMKLVEQCIERCVIHSLDSLTLFQLIDYYKTRKYDKLRNYLIL